MYNKFVPLGIVLIAFIALVFVKPMALRIREVNASVKAYDQQIKEANDKINALRSLQPQLEDKQSEIDALKVAMPAAQQIPEALVMMESIAKNAGLQITGVEIQPGKANNMVSVNVSGLGRYESLFKFTEVLERNIRPIQVQTLSVGKSGDAGDMVSATVSLGLVYQGSLDQQVAN
jgi:Tfp pilus assembly protein PilO